MKIHVPTILDALFSAFISFIITFIILFYFIQRIYAVTFAVILSIPVLIIAYTKLKDKREVKLSDKKTQKLMDFTFSQLKLYTQSQINELFFTALTKKSFVAVRKKGFILIPDKNALIMIRLSFNDVTNSDIVRAFNSITKEQTAYIFCESLSSSTRDFLSRFGGRVNAVEKKQVFDLLNSTECLPKTRFNFKDPKPFSNGVLYAFFSRKKAKSYFSFGIIFLFMSFIVPIKLYYVIFGCVFLFVSLICRVYGKSEQQTKTDK